MKSIILVGPQGSGKGTQARILADLFDYTIFETGGILRAMAKEESELGKKVKDITSRGDLVPNEIVMEIVADFIDKASDKKIIFDGIPRSEMQRETLESLLAEKNIDWQAVEIKLPIELSKERLVKRAEIEGRVDDTPTVIERRLKNFFEYTEPLINHWRENNQLVSVNGNQAVEDVSAQVIEALQLIQEENAES
jgi:adenylate kinase